LGRPDFDRFFGGAELVGAARLVFASVALMAPNNARFSPYGAPRRRRRESDESHTLRPDFEGAGNNT
jgi:hypothetical protein